MNLLNKLTELKIKRITKKRMNLLVKLQDKQQFYDEMVESVRCSPIHLDFVHKYWEEKIGNLQAKIESIDKKLETEVQKYNQRINGDL